jgi:hypothetical protein
MKDDSLELFPLDLTNARPDDIQVATAQLKSLLHEGGNLPVLSSIEVLRQAEVLHLRVGADWNELVRESENGNITERLRQLATGCLQVTNQRIVFESRTKKGSIELKDVVDLSRLADHLFIELLGPHDPCFTVEPAAALEITELVIGSLLERIRRNKKARFVGR